MPSRTTSMKLFPTHQKVQLRRNATEIFTKPQHQIWDFWEVKDYEKLLSWLWETGEKFMISGTRPFHQVIPLKFVHLPFHHLSLCFTHVLLRDKKCSQGLKSFFYPRPKGSKKKKKKNQVAKMITKWVMLQKDAPERKPKAATSSLLQAAMTYRIQAERGKWVRPFCCTSRVETKARDSPSAPTLHFPSPGCSYRRKNKLPFALL